jgi:hypothetical protein
MEVILYGLVAFVVAVAIGAAIIMLATRLVAGFTPKFLSAAIAALVASIAGFCVSFGLQMVLGAGGLSSLLVLVIYFLLNSAIINALIKRPDGSQMGFGKAALVTLLEIIIEIVLGVILVFVFGAGIMAMIGMGAAGAMH